MKTELKVNPCICGHPELYPTDWNQPRPEPCAMIVFCECGENQVCPICGSGKGQYPCSCTRENSLDSDNDTEVMHEVFFGENIKRVMKTLFPH